MNIHNEEIGGIYGEQGNGIKAGTAYESGRSGQRYGAEHISSSETSRTGGSADRLDGKKQGDSRGDLREGDGNLGESVNDYSPDYAAWRNFMKEGHEGENNRYSSEPTNETNQTDSLTETQEAVRTAVREELERMGKEYGWIKAGEKPFRDVQIPRKRSPETQLYSIEIKETSGSIFRLA